MAMITVGSVKLPNPTSYKVKGSDLDSESTERNELGYMQRDRVRANIRRIDVSWNVSKAEYQIIAAAIAPSEFPVTFFDPDSGPMRTATMYASDRDGSLTVYVDENEPDKSRWVLACALIEC